MPLNTSSLLSKTAKGASFLIILQISSRAFSFLVNQLLLRYVSPELFGVSVQLEAYSISVLFFARESLRVVIQRQTDTTENENEHSQEKTEAGRAARGSKGARKTQVIVNLAYVSVGLGIFFAVALAWLYLRSLHSTPILHTPYFTEALRLYGIATFLELLSEPCFVVVQQKSEYGIRATAESVATVSRCLVTCVTTVFAFNKGLDIGVLPFALGQLVYGISLLFIYFWKVKDIASADGFSLTARPIRSSNGDYYLLSYFSPSLLALATSLFVQGAVKHVLTQGDLILISYLASLQAQGIYALASNYGGLIARTVFQPVEETSRNYFGKLLSSTDGPPSKDNVDAARKDLHNLLRLYNLFSVFAISLGPTIAPILLKYVAGSGWSSSGAGGVLAKYCYYIPLLAVNGVTEAFVSAVAIEPELNKQSLWLFAFSAGFGAAGYIFLQVFDMGAEGLVWANVINMALRIIWSISFIDGYLKRNGSSVGILEVMPEPTTIAVSLITTPILAQIKATFTGGLGDLIKCVLTAIAFFTLICICERRYILYWYHFIRNLRSSTI